MSQICICIEEVRKAIQSEVRKAIQSEVCKIRSEVKEAIRSEVREIHEAFKKKAEIEADFTNFTFSLSLASELSSSLHMSPNKENHSNNYLMSVGIPEKSTVEKQEKKKKKKKRNKKPSGRIPKDPRVKFLPQQKNAIWDYQLGVWKSTVGGLTLFKIPGQKKWHTQESLRTS